MKDGRWPCVMYNILAKQDDHWATIFANTSAMLRRVTRTHPNQYLDILTFHNIIHQTWPSSAFHCSTASRGAAKIGTTIHFSNRRPQSPQYKRTCLIKLIVHLFCPVSLLRTFAPKSSYGEIFFISPLELVDKVLTPKMKKKMGVTDFVSEKMAVEKCLNFDKSVIITRCSLLC